MQPAPSLRANCEKIRLPGGGLSQNRFHRLPAETPSVGLDPGTPEFLYPGLHLPLGVSSVRRGSVGVYDPNRRSQRHR